MKNNPWKSGLLYLAIGIVVIILSPILIPILICLYIRIVCKDPHTECNKGNHVYEKTSPTKGFTHRCKNCGLLN